MGRLGSALCDQVPVDDPAPSAPLGCPGEGWAGCGLQGPDVLGKAGGHSCRADTEQRAGSAPGCCVWRRSESESPRCRAGRSGEQVPCPPPLADTCAPDGAAGALRSPCGVTPLPSPGPPAWPLSVRHGTLRPSRGGAPQGDRPPQRGPESQLFFQCPVRQDCRDKLQHRRRRGQRECPGSVLAGCGLRTGSWAGGGGGAGPWAPRGTRGLGRSPARLCLRPAAATTFSPLMTRRTTTSGRTRRPTAPPG